MKPHDSHSSLILGEAFSDFIGDDNQNMTKAFETPTGKMIMQENVIANWQVNWLLTDYFSFFVSLILFTLC